MESAFTGLVRTHKVPFKANTSIISHNTIIAVGLFFSSHRVCVFITRSLCVPFLFAVPLLVPVRANATGIKKWQSEELLTKTNQPSDRKT